jgi:hypothetical protein
VTTAQWIVAAIVYSFGTFCAWMAWSDIQTGKGVLPREEADNIGALLWVSTVAAGAVITWVLTT